MRGDAGRVRRVQGRGVLLSEATEPAGLHFDGDELEPRMVWIFGSPRTGSTWLLELLAYPLSLEARDPLGFRAPVALPGPIDLVPINESLLPTHLSPPGTGRWYVRDRPSIRVPADTFGDLAAYFFSQHFEDVWRPAVRTLAHARFGAHLERAAATYPVDQKALLVIKEPNGSHAAPLIMSLLPRSRLIFLYRDGRDVVDSQVALNSPGGLSAAWRGVAVETSEQRLELIREESLNWVARMTETERVYQERPPELRRRIRYEDLVADPGGCLAGLTDWLGLDRDPAVTVSAIEAHALGSPGQSSTGAAATRRSATPGLWRENLSAEESALAHEIMGEKLADLGYEVAPELGAVT